MDLSTRYMGLDLKNPLVVSANPLSARLDNIRQMEDAGAAAVVLFSLFEEQLKHDEFVSGELGSGMDSFAESLSYLPEGQTYSTGPDQYLELIRQAKIATDLPIIGSLNGVTLDSWVDYAKQIEQAGADGLELNVFFPTSGLTDAAAGVEQRYIEILKAVKAAVNLPVALKLGPYFSSFGNVAKQFDEAGADALVLFNRFYQPDFDIEQLEIKPCLPYSTPHDIGLPLRWIAVLHGQLNASLGATSGVYGPEEVIKYLLGGADAVMTASCLLRMGISHLSTLLTGLERWMAGREFESVAEMKGVMSQKEVINPEALERVNYMKIFDSFKSQYA